MESPIILISDLHGNTPHEKLTSFLGGWKIQAFDSRQLAHLPMDLFGNKEAIHRAFTAFGIERAAKQLLIELSLGLNPIVVGFSVGGVIAWRAALRGLPIRKLILFSATRLRYETQRPNCPIGLYYGQKDAYQPSAAWAAHLGLDKKVIADVGHDFYQEADQLRPLLFPELGY